MIIAVLAIFGVILGSFVNALVWRLHEQEVLSSQFSVLRKKKRTTKKEVEKLRTKNQELSVLTGRSMCPNCHHTLAAKDLVPVLSWLWLRGKCRYCSKAISWQYPAVELLTGLLFALSYVSWPNGLSGVGLYELAFWLFYLVVFMVLAVYDLRWFLLPDKIVFPLIGVAVLETVSVAVWKQSWAALWGPLAGGVVIFGLFYLLFQVSKGAWIGGGDVKLAFALGLIVGSPLAAFMVIFFASLLGTLGSVPLLVRGKSNLKAHIPFGPYLLAATVLVGLYGDTIMHWYTNLFSGTF